MKKSFPYLKLALGLLALSFIPAMASAEDAVTKEKKPSKATLEKYDTNKDDQLSDEEKAKAKEASKEKAKHTREATLAKYDTNKDGKLEDTEKAAKKADEEAAHRRLEHGVADHPHAVRPHAQAQQSQQVGEREEGERGEEPERPQAREERAASLRAREEPAEADLIGVLGRLPDSLAPRLRTSTATDGCGSGSRAAPAWRARSSAAAWYCQKVRLWPASNAVEASLHRKFFLSVYSEQTMRFRGWITSAWKL